MHWKDKKYPFKRGLFLYRLGKIAIILVMTIPILSCSTKKDTDKFSGTSIDTSAILRYRLDGDPPTLDPAHCTDTRSAAVILKIFDGLVKFEPKTMKILPAVAKRWEISENGLIYINIF